MREADFASIERIGVGQFATVHSSRVSGGKFAAVKIWHRPVAITDANDLPSGSDYDEPLPIDLADIACFAQEVALLASSDLAHPNVVKYLGHGFVPIPGTNRVRGFVAMELVEGETYYEFRERAPQEELNRTARVLYEFVFGTFHRHGLFNADPHPGNYVFLGDGRVAFLDFGCVQDFPIEVPASFARMLRLLGARPGQL